MTTVTATAPAPVATETRAGSGLPVAQPGAGGPDADLGIMGFAPPGCPPVYSADIVRIGPATSDPERDDLGHVVVGDACK